MSMVSRPWAHNVMIPPPALQCSSLLSLAFLAVQRDAFYKVTPVVPHVAQ